MASKASENAASDRRVVLDGAGLIDVRKVAALLRRRWLTITIASAVVVLLVIFAYHFTKPVYSATAQVALDRRDDQLGGSTQDQELPTDSPQVDTEVQALGSPALATRVVDRLKLTRDPEYSGQALTPAEARRKAIATLLGRVKIKRTGLSYAIGVSVDSWSSVQAAKIANGVVDEYVASRVGYKEADRQREIALLRQRLAQIGPQVVAAEQQMAQYRASHDLVDVNAGGTAASAAATALNGQLAAAKAEQAAADARLGTARAQLARGGSGEELGAALNSGVIQGLRAQQASLSAQRADMAGRYGPMHPDLARVDRQLGEVNAAIKAEVSRVISNLESEARVAHGRTGSLQSSIAASEGQLRVENAASVPLNELQRKMEASRNLYQALLERQRIAVARQGTDQAVAHVIAYAIPPSSPSSPSVPVYAILAIVGAIAASAAAVALLEMAEGGVKTSDDLEYEFGIQSLGLVPDIASVPGAGVSRRDPVAPSDYLLAKPGSVFAESFRSVRTAVRRAPEGGDVRVIAVTSALPNEGKTTLSICLARSTALAGSKVLLIDTDMRQRASSRELAASVEVGLAEVLRGTATLDQALVEDTESGALLLPQSGKADLYDLLESPAMRALLDDARQRFDLVVLDCAPILPVAESRQAAALADRTVLAVRWRQTPKKAVNHALRLLEQVGAVVVGGVLTRADLKALARGGYGDPAYFYNRYKAYYAA